MNQQATGTARTVAATRMPYSFPLNLCETHTSRGHAKNTFGLSQFKFNLKNYPKTQFYPADDFRVQIGTRTLSNRLPNYGTADISWSRF